MKQIRNSLWGLVFIILGLVVGLNALGITNINLFFKGWWTLFIIVPCFIDLFNNKDKVGNCIGLIFGILLLLSCYDLFSFDIVFKLFCLSKKSLSLPLTALDSVVCLSKLQYNLDNLLKIRMKQFLQRRGILRILFLMKRRCRI